MSEDSSLWTIETQSHRKLYNRILNDYISAELAAAGAGKDDFIIRIESGKKTKDVEICEVCGRDVVPVDQVRRIMRQNKQQIRAAVRLAELALKNPGRADIAFDTARLGRKATNWRAAAIAISVADPSRLRDIRAQLVEQGHFVPQNKTLAATAGSWVDRATRWLEENRFTPDDGDELAKRWASTARTFDALKPEVHTELDDDGQAFDKKASQTCSAEKITRYKLVNDTAVNWYSSATTKTPFANAGPPAYFQAFALLDSAVELARMDTDTTRSTAIFDYPLFPGYLEVPSTEHEVASVSNDWYEEFFDAVIDFARIRTLQGFEPCETIELDIGEARKRWTNFLNPSAEKSAETVNLTDRIWMQLEMARGIQPNRDLAVDPGDPFATIIDTAQDFAQKFALSSRSKSDWDVIDEDLRSELQKLLDQAAPELGVAIVNLVFNHLESAGLELSREKQDVDDQ